MLTARTNLISTEFLDQCLPNWVNKSEPCAMQVVGVNNDVMSLDMQIKLSLTNQEIKFDVTFFISNSLKAILGSEFF